MQPDIQSQLNAFFSTQKPFRMKKGDILIHAGEEPAGIFYLKEGTVKEYTISHKGEEVVVNIFKPIAFFPMSWAINGGENNYFFEATSDISGFRAPKDAVVTFIKQNPDVVYDLLSRLYRGLAGLTTRVAYLMSETAYHRLINELCITAKRFGSKNAVGKISFSINEKDLAAQAGLTRETVSREMAQLKKKGLVSFDKNMLLINDCHELEKEMDNF